MSTETSPDRTEYIKINKKKRERERARERKETAARKIKIVTDETDVLEVKRKPISYDAGVKFATPELFPIMLSASVFFPDSIFSCFFPVQGEDEEGAQRTHLHTYPRRTIPAVLNLSTLKLTATK